MVLPRPAEQLPRICVPDAAAPTSARTLAALLDGLNREQRRAVTHRAGPALVIAGPGTGKTEVVTRRVAWLIAAKLARPREILALTFTDNAAQEMQARVDVLVPYGQADAHIHTFHAFGDRLLREHAFELGLPADARLLPRPELVVLLREHLFELGLERYLPLGDPTRFLGALVDLFGRAKDEDLSPADLAAHAARLTEAVHATDADHAALADLAAARAEIALAFERYTRLLATAGLIDHADQVALALRLLRERPAVRGALADRYRYILVDELQDTNRAQLELVLALSDRNRNVTAVGDPEQGIYGFRGARTGNLERFAVAMPGLRTIALRRNYRSLAPIIAAAGRVRQRATTDVLGQVDQVAHRRRRGVPLRHVSFSTPEDEADGVALEIEARLHKGAKPADVAVLVRSNGETDAIVRSLRVRGIPTDSGTRRNLFDALAVRPLLAFLRVVSDPGDSVELYALASAPPYGLPGSDLAVLLSGSRRRNRSLWDALTDAIDSADSRLRPESLTRGALLLEHVRAGVKLAAERPSGEVLYDYLRRSGRLKTLARADADPADARAVARFCEVARARAALLVHDRVPFLVGHLAAREIEDDSEAEPDEQSAVRVLTVHRAKGLEFGTVFICGLVDGRFPVRSRPAALALPGELLGDAADGDDAAVDEERRLFYVALTRARDDVWLTSHTNGPRGRGRRRPSLFIAEALDLPASPPAAAAAAARVTKLEHMLVEPARPPGATLLPASLKLSYSQVDEYLSCPERYRLRYAIGVPTPPHHALSYGSAMHQTIAAFHGAQMRGETMSEDDLIAELGRNWQPDGFVSRDHEEARFAAGREALVRFRTQQLASGARPVAVERPFLFRIGEHEIRGRIDRLDRAAEGAVITDYKSSDVRDQKRADTRARDSLQLQVYALAHQADTGELPAAVQLHFVETGVVGRASPDQARLDKARDRVLAAADGIRSGTFEPSPSPITCGFCPFRSICSASAA